jgi:hypothetical protein
MKLIKTFRAYAAAHETFVHVIFDPSARLAQAVDRFVKDNGGSLLLSGKTIDGKSERFFIMKSAATARKLAKILTGSYRRIA